MAVLFGTQMTKIDSVAATPAPGFVHGTVRCFAEQVNLATITAANGAVAPATTDTIEVGLIPKGSVFLYGILNTSVTMGASATIAIGIAGTTGKYRAAATITAQTTELFGLTPVGGLTGQNVAETADRKVILTIAVASLPAVGILNVTLFYAHN